VVGRVHRCKSGLDVNNINHPYFHTCYSDMTSFWKSYLLGSSEAVLTEQVSSRSRSIPLFPCPAAMANSYTTNLIYTMEGVSNKRIVMLEVSHVATLCAPRWRWTWDGMRSDT
jgi:hypothetical protein